MKSLYQYLTEGAWGYEPDQNDGTLDLRGNIFSAMCEMVYDMCSKNPYSKDFATDHAWESLGAIEYFFEEITKMDDFGVGDKEFDKYYYWWRLIELKQKNIVELYEKLLNTCVNDEKWISGWKEPEKMRESLEKRKNVLNHWKTLITEYKDYQEYLERTRQMVDPASATAIG
jgi:hypothetical protein